MPSTTKYFRKQDNVKLVVGLFQIFTSENHRNWFCSHHRSFWVLCAVAWTTIHRPHGVTALMGYYGSASQRLLHQSGPGILAGHGKNQRAVIKTLALERLSTIKINKGGNPRFLWCFYCKMFECFSRICTWSSTDKAIMLHAPVRKEFSHPYPNTPSSFFAKKTSTVTVDYIHWLVAFGDTHRIHGAGIYANIGGILRGSMLPYIAAPWILWDIEYPQETQQGTTSPTWCPCVTCVLISSISGPQRQLRKPRNHSWMHLGIMLSV